MNINREIVFVQVLSEAGTSVVETPCKNWAEATAKAREYALVVDPSQITFHVEPLN